MRLSTCRSVDRIGLVSARTSIFGVSRLRNPHWNVSTRTLLHKRRLTLDDVKEGAAGAILDLHDP